MLRYIRFIVICLVLCTAYAVHGQTVEFSANAAAQKVGLKDGVTIQYIIKGANSIKAFVPPAFADFNVVQGPYQSQSTEMNVVGNQMVQHQSVQISYVLQPKRTGVLTIPPAIIKDGEGHTYQSNALTIQAVPGSVAGQQRQQARRNPFGDDPFGDDDPFAAMQQMQMRQRQLMQRMLQAQRQGGQQQQQQAAPPEVSEKDINKDIFIKVTVDKSNVHVGEQVTTSYKLYSRIPMQVGISKLPSLNGFWTQDFDIPKQPKPTEEILNGKKYQVFLLKKSALFPQQTGTLELDPAEAQGVARIIQQVRQRNPFADMFDDPAIGSLMMNDPLFNSGFFSSLAYKDVQVHLKSTPVKINVSPLPDKNKPADFGGAVGSFTIAGKMAKTELTTDDATNFTITITGSGNLKLIEAPKLNLPNGLDSYDPQIIDTITGRSTTISGSKIITYAITPHTPGDYEMPPIPFSYYNPQTGTYTSLQTLPIKIHVKPGKHYNPAVASATGGGLNDIHDINNKPVGNINFNSRPLLFTTGYWSMYALPLLALIGMLVWKKRDEEQAKDSVSLRNKRANKVALKRLSAAQKYLEQKNTKPFYEEVSKAIWLYLSDKLNIPLSSLSHESAQTALLSGKITPAQQDKLKYVLLECETALYANRVSATEMNRAYQDAVKIISELEETLKA